MDNIRRLAEHGLALTHGLSLDCFIAIINIQNNLVYSFARLHVFILPH